MSITESKAAKDRARRAELDASVRAAVAEIKFPLPRPDGLTREEIKARAAAVESAVADMKFPSPTDTTTRDRKAIEARNAAVVAAVEKGNAQ